MITGRSDDNLNKKYEDLIKGVKEPIDEEATAAAQYTARSKAVNKAVSDLQKRLKTHAKRASKEPMNWGFPGDLGHVNSVLQDLLTGFRG